MIIETLFIMFMMLAVTVGGFIGIVLYFLPAIIAFSRKHEHILAICLINLLLGWTFLGWFAALLWSLNRDTKQV